MVWLVLACKLLNIFLLPIKNQMINTDIKIIEGGGTEIKARYAIVASRFNDQVVQLLIDGALDALERHGVNNQAICLYRVPGALEVPFIVDKLAASGAHDVVIALGAVIRGETAHFDIVAGESARGLLLSMLDHGIPITNGILTTDTVEQAIERADMGQGNKGGAVALAAIELLGLLKQLP